MNAKRIIYYILAAFIVGTLALVYIQYNSSKNINRLINGNDRLLNEVMVSNELKELEKDILIVESNVRGAVVTSNRAYIKNLNAQFITIEAELKQLQKISDNDSSVRYIDELDTVVHQKMRFARSVVDSLVLRGKSSAEKMITTESAKLLNDSIARTIQKIDNTRKEVLAEATTAIDRSGENALELSTLLIIAVLIAAAALFWYIINIIQKQIRLIGALNESEKKVRESVRVKEQFMANMSHEIRTPLNAILGFTNLLQRQSLNQQSGEYVQTIQKSGENLLTIINDILDLSKIEAGMVRIEKTPFSIRGLLHSVAVMFHSRVIEKGIELKVNVADDIPDTLVGDASRLTQILVNLISNALKFTPKGTIDIAVSSAGIIDNILTVSISVTDTGIGIAADKIDHIFDRFQQAEDSITRNYGGTGLGLSIVKELIAMQGGTIQVASELGKGTSFRLLIPYSISTEQISWTPQATNTTITPQNFEHIRVLVAEDNEINQSLLRHLFMEWEIHHEFAGNGRDAIEKLQKNVYDLILMDIQMPEMDGYTATQYIREQLQLKTPIIAMTAHALAGEREKCLSYGMNDYISKPIREELLYQLITQYTPLVTNPRSLPANGHSTPYQYIRLDYMRSISAGNKEYEQTVTEQFLDAVPEELKTIELAWQQRDIDRVRKLAHNMRTTVSVMELNETLSPYLDVLEYQHLDAADFHAAFQPVKSICEQAMEEARKFLQTF